MFPRAPLTFTGAPGNIQGILDGYDKMSFTDYLTCTLSLGLVRDCPGIRSVARKMWVKSTCTKGRESRALVTSQPMMFRFHLYSSLIV